MNTASVISFPWGFLLASVLTAWLPTAGAQPFPCDGAAYVFVSTSEESSDLYRVRIDDGNGRLTYEPVLRHLGYPIAAAGYSTFDGFIYALEATNLDVLRIDAAGNITNLGFPNGLEREMTYHAGTISPSGRRFFVIGRHPDSGNDDTLFSIAVGPTSRLSAGRVSVLNEFNSRIEDMTYDPVRGVLYGYDATTNKLVQVDQLSGLVVNYFSQTMRSVGNLGSLFFSRSGQLYGYGATSGATSGTTFFPVRKTNGEAGPSQMGPSGGNSDACGCPYTVRVRKRAIPARVAPCTGMTLSYELINHAGTSYSFRDFIDTLPEGFVIEEVVQAPLGARVAGGTGTNVLHLDNFDLLLDTNRIVVRVSIGEEVAPGVYRSRAALSAFPPALGEVVYSDDPLTAAELDATAIEVVAGEALDLRPELRPACDGSGVAVTVDLADADYRWSTGDTTRNIFVTAPGNYGITVTTGCQTYAGEVTVAAIPEPLTLTLQDPPPIELGQSLTLQPQVNKTAGLSYAWNSSAAESALSCLDCPAPVARPVVNTTYYLTVTDEPGCTASDSLFVEVLPVEKIFVPNAFSPDNDGVNDVFFVQGLAGSARVLALRVFDRWGGLLYEGPEGALNDPTHGWDGTARGRRLPAGVYLWAAELEFADGRKKMLGGEVSLLRR